MSRQEALKKCTIWYVAAVALSPWTCLLLGSWHIAFYCMVGLPGLVGFFAAVLLGLSPMPFFVTACFIHVGLCVSVAFSGDPSTRKKLCWIFLALVVLDACVAVMSPILYLSLLGAGE